MYMNGTTASDEDILWINANQPSFSDRDCGAIKTETPRSGQDHLEALSGNCDESRYALCQFSSCQSSDPTTFAVETTTTVATTIAVETTTTAAETTTTAIPGCYHYEVSATDDYTWQEAGNYCVNKGGNLAYHGLDTIDKRE